MRSSQPLQPILTIRFGNIGNIGKTTPRNLAGADNVDCNDSIVYAGSLDDMGQYPEVRNMNYLPTLLTRARVLNTVLKRLGPARALEAAETHVTPEPNKHGCVGVDYTNGKYRARIRYCDALSGEDVRVTLIRTDSLDEADWAYRYAHVALWGSASWAASDDIIESLRVAQG